LADTLSLERKARRRQRYVLVAVAIGLLVSSTLGVAAWGQRNQYLDEAQARATAQAQTEVQRQEAVTERDKATTAQALAEQQQQEAVKQRDLATTAQAQAEQQRQVAEQQQQIAEQQRDIAVSRLLADQALGEFNIQNLDAGLLLAVEAVRHTDTMDARSSLLRLIQAVPQMRYYVPAKGGSGGDSVAGVAVSSDGRTIASSNADGTISLRDVATGKPSHADLSGTGFLKAGKNPFDQTTLDSLRSG
jgi:hypothetical protein